MNKAEERALEAYPKYISYSTDYTAHQRMIFQRGYEKAEKDNELTIKDLELLHTFLYAVKNNKQGAFTFTKLSDKQYNEVLRRFREVKNANV